jgi:DNA repair exonuclease SbcCD ATPase subunit
MHRIEIADEDVDSLDDTVAGTIKVPVDHLTVSQRLEFLIAEYRERVAERDAAIERAETAEADLENALERARTAEENLDDASETIEELEAERETLEEELDAVRNDEEFEYGDRDDAESEDEADAEETAV